jgi:hypothetical protein
MDWDSFRRRVFERAGAAQTIPDTYDAIRLALTLLGDKHTYYRTAAGVRVTDEWALTRTAFAASTAITAHVTTALSILSGRWFGEHKSVSLSSRNLTTLYDLSADWKKGHRFVAGTSPGDNIGMRSFNLLF